jgi:hypothetical protein
MRLTKRGKRVRAFSIVLGVALVYMLGTHIHYTGAGYCFGTFDKCYALEGEGKK